MERSLMEVFKNSASTESLIPIVPHIHPKIAESLMEENGIRDGFYTFPELLGSEVDRKTYYDPVHKYPNEEPSFTFRSPAPGDKDLVAMGCSQTYGIGVCEENTWPALLAKDLDISYVNIAVPGYSIARCVLSFFSYIETYGKPKAVAFLLPDMYRMYFPVGSPHSYAQNVPEKQKIKMTDATFSLYSGSDKSWEKLAPAFSKRPHRIEDIFYPEVSYSQGFTMLNTLLVFCKYAGISIVIDTWDKELSYLLNSLDYLSDDVFANTYVEHSRSGCVDHEDFKDSLKHEEFHNATDGTPNANQPHSASSHMGAHKHIHFAGQFGKKLRKQMENGQQQK